MAGALGDKRGFTLTELMVVVAIIILLTSIVVPNIAGRLTVARMHAAEDQIAEIEAALAAYHADFGTYPGDVFPSEDLNNDGVLMPNEDADCDDALGAGEDLNGNGVLDLGEDRGVDVDRDGTRDYALCANGRLDQGDGVINIHDLEWALKTTAKNGPYMDSIPLDPWGNKYAYHAPLRRPTGPNRTNHFLYVLPGSIRNEDNMSAPPKKLNGRLDQGEDIGVARYSTAQGAPHIEASFVGKFAGAGNGILDHGDDDNKNNTLEYYNLAVNDRTTMEWGNADISPDGLTRNLGYYIYSVGRNKRDETATGYEDINLNSQLDTALDNNGGAGDPFSEDIDADGELDTGYEDTGIDGIPGTKDKGEDDWNDANAYNPTITSPDPNGQPDEEFGTKDASLGGPDEYHYNTHHDPTDPESGQGAEGFDIGGDDINSWNKNRPWREHNSYGG